MDLFVNSLKEVILLLFLLFFNKYCVNIFEKRSDVYGLRKEDVYNFGFVY